MSEKEMADYLDEETADYDFTLDISPHNVLEEMCGKIQDRHQFDDGSVSTVTLSQDNYYLVNLLWDHLTMVDAGTIFDLFNDENQANGLANSFYWEHPRDGHTYTVRFEEALNRNYMALVASRTSIPKVVFRVTGVKPS